MATSNSDTFSTNMTKTQQVITQIAAKQKSMSKTLTKIETLVNSLQAGWSTSYTDTVKSTMKTYLSNIRTKQETLAENTEKYLNYTVELSQATENSIEKNLYMFLGHKD